MEPRLAALAAETRAAFAWLTDGLDPDEPVSFVPNPGNVGDAAINLACWRHLAARFARIEICPFDGRPRHRQVFIGGGGNLVEPLWQQQKELLERLDPAQHRIGLFPATLHGFAGLLQRWRGRLRVVCRENVSHAFAGDLLGRENVHLGHDSAFALAGALPGTPPGAQAGAQAGTPPDARRDSGEEPGGQAPTLAAARFLRQDREGVVALPQGEGDLTGRPVGRWLEPAAAEAAVAGAVGRLEACAAVATDRLHVAILAALLVRPTTLYPNSYFKNRAVFERSLHRLPWVTFAEAVERRASVPANDPLLYRASLRRREPLARRLLRSAGGLIGL